jgi:regulator of extracellular matrix RemA (YlzA/DUF370 family)
MKSGPIIRYCVILAVLVMAIVMSSCGSGYQDMPFGGMKGRVQKLTVIHKEPEMWHTGKKSTDVMSIEASAYDINGNEICSAQMDSAGRVLGEAESLFENGVCIRSTQKSGKRVIARLNLLSHTKHTLEYKKEVLGKSVRMVVKKSSFGRRHKSVVIEDGNTVTISVIRTDRNGYPVKIKEVQPQTGFEALQLNVYDDDHNLIEKRVKTSDEEKEEIIYTKYSDFDEKGNWREARTFNRNGFPVEVLVREIEYW